jgi:hypothetical protein
VKVLLELKKNLPPVQPTEFLDDDGNPIPDSALEQVKL